MATFIQPTSGQNQWGPWTLQPSAVANYTANPVSAPIAPQSPSGSVTGQSAASNFASGVTSTQQELTGVVEAAQQGKAAQNAPQTFSCTWMQGNSYKWA